MTTTATQRAVARDEEIRRIIARLAHQILEPEEARRGLVLLGVRRGGEALATRLASEIERISGSAPALGFLNINLYRDDRVTHELPDSRIPVDVSSRIVIIVDDVLFVRVNEPKARSERVSRPIRSSTQHLPTGKVGADSIVSPASSLMLRVGSGAHLWNAPTTGQCRCRFRLRRAAYDKAS